MHYLQSINGATGIESRFPKGSASSNLVLRATPLERSGNGVLEILEFSPAFSQKADLVLRVASYGWLLRNCTLVEGAAAMRDFARFRQPFSKRLLGKKPLAKGLKMLAGVNWFID